MKLPTLDKNALLDRLESLLCEHPGGAVVFDADGTLWSHDVGAMVFEWACAQGAFRQEALGPLIAEAQRLGLQPRSGDGANDVALALQKAWEDGSYEERSAAEMQVWAYVGFSKSEFHALSRDALIAGKHHRSLHDDVLEIAEWLVKRGTSPRIVSASPLWVVEEAVRSLCFFEIGDVAAGIPNTHINAGEPTILPGLKAPLPYGPDKVGAGRELLMGSPWLAALGDSHFDLDMMREAKLAIGIGNKSDMLEGLSLIPGGLRLSLSQGGL